MCTVSWRNGDDGYDLFFNRDELDRRAPESPPRLSEAPGVSFLAPRDGDRGGTWLLVNHHGVTACVLNDYGDPWRPADDAVHSRGQIVLACASARDAQEAFTLTRRQPLARCRSFQLLLLAPGQAPARLRWRGGRSAIDSGPSLKPPLSSSSWNTEAVVASRKKVYGRMVTKSSSEPDTGQLWRYHLDHDPAHGASSVLMRRPDAATRSIIHVAVNAAAICLRYRPVSRVPSAMPPDEVRLRLERAPTESVALGKC